MLGFLFGTACLIGLFWVYRRGHWYGSCGRGTAHHRHWRDEGHWSGERGGRFMLRWLFERLDTSPGQEKVIRTEVDQLFDKLDQFKRAIADGNRDAARAFRADDFNAEILGDVFARHDSAIDELRKAALGSLARVHDVLDPRQRARLAELLESMPGRWGGPYRSWA